MSMKFPGPPKILLRGLTILMDYLEDLFVALLYLMIGVAFTLYGVIVLTISIGYLIVMAAGAVIYPRPDTKNPSS